MLRAQANVSDNPRIIYCALYRIYVYSLILCALCDIIYYYTYIHTCIYIYIHIYIYIYLFVYLFIHLFIYLFIYLFI